MNLRYGSLFILIIIIICAQNLLIAKVYEYPEGFNNFFRGPELLREDNAVEISQGDKLEQKIEVHQQNIQDSGSLDLGITEEIIWVEETVSSSYEVNISSAADTVQTQEKTADEKSSAAYEPVKSAEEPKPQISESSSSQQNEPQQSAPVVLPQQTEQQQQDVKQTVQEIEEIIFLDEVISNSFTDIEISFGADTVQNVSEPVSAPVQNVPAAIKEQETQNQNAQQEPSQEQENEIRTPVSVQQQPVLTSTPSLEPAQTTQEPKIVIKEEIEYVVDENVDYYFPSLTQPPYTGVILKPEKKYIQRIEPANNSSITNLIPLFLWDPIQGVDYYQFYLSKTPISENNIIMIKNISENKYQFAENDSVEPLKNKIQYSWFVAAFNTDNEIISINDANTFSSFTINLAEPAAAASDSEQIIEDTSVISDTSAAERNISDTSEIISSDIPETTAAEPVEIIISDIRLNNKSVEIFEKESSFTKEDLENDMISITGNLTGSNALKSFTISYDDGGSFNNITFIKQQQPYQFKYSFKPQDNSVYKFKIIAVSDDGRTFEEDYFYPLEKLTFINKTQQDMVKDLLSDLCKSYLTNDKDLFIDCLASSFSGSNEGYLDYTDVQTSIKKVFDKTVTMTCVYQNEKINIMNSSRAQVDFVFKRKFKFDDIERNQDITVNASFELIKENNGWKILSDKNGLIFIKNFPDIPATPY
ncbi:hypothetical protein KA977_06820 [Candidatus Dependentiae bacterium]|nr:hypothetical protein [Candidatus Dependentiae bacterium]